MLTLSHLLDEWRLDPAACIVMRHRPSEPLLRKAFPGIVRTRPELLDAYQSVHGTAEGALTKAGWLISTAGEEPGHATFIGLFRRAGQDRWDRARIMALPAYRELISLGVSTEGWRNSYYKFRLEQRVTGLEFRLLLRWPPPERSWYRWANKNVFEIAGILRSGETEPPLPDWNTWRVGWAELTTLPRSWADALRATRGIYYIFDRATHKGYVGSAGGGENLLQRWQNYALTGHGGNRGLISVAPENLAFSILERTSPDMERAKLVALESSWKERLWTRAPHGHNRN